MKQGKVFYNKILAGLLWQSAEGEYFFQYHPQYLENPAYPAISVHFPKSASPFRSPVLFPFFFNMISEGANRSLQLNRLKLDESDYMGLLINTASGETIGAITVSA